MSQLTLQNSQISIMIDSHGAELVSIRKNNQEFLYQKQPGFWQRQSPILFPIVGGLKGGIYEYEERIFSLPQHGFARDMQWDCQLIDDASIVCILRSSDETLQKYPFEFVLTLKYTIYESTLYVEYSIENTSEDNLLLASLGAHPAFAIKDSISEYSLVFNQDDMLIVDQLTEGLLSDSFDILLQDHRLVLSENLFAHDALILRQLKTARIELYHHDSKILTFDRGNFPHFGIWKQKNAPFICLEPWHGFTDANNSSGIWNEKAGLFVLEPYEIRDFAWFVQI